MGAMKAITAAPIGNAYNPHDAKVSLDDACGEKGHVKLPRYDEQIQGNCGRWTCIAVSVKRT